jgi:acetyl-CoA synthetase
LDLKDEDIYWCTADPGGLREHLTELSVRGLTVFTQCSIAVLLENWYRFIEKHKITVWYSAPTAIRSLMKEGNEIVKKFDLSLLRHLASVGEPLNAEAVIWSKEVFGLEFHDTYWQTETGSIMISNYPGMKIKPGSMGKPFPGITATVVDLNTHLPLEKKGVVGMIAAKLGWPAMFRTYWNISIKHIIINFRMAGTCAAIGQALMKTDISGLSEEMMTLLTLPVIWWAV